MSAWTVSRLGAFKRSQARGIDRVIVVANSTSFSDTAIKYSFGYHDSKELCINVELALNTGTKLDLSANALESLNSTGVGFLNDPGFESVTGGLAKTSLLNDAGAKAIFDTFNPKTNSKPQLTLEDGLLINKKTFGKEKFQ